MKKNISIRVEEIRQIVPLVKNKVQGLKINSNPTNYEKLNTLISEETNVSVGNRFLCKFLFESQKTSEDYLVFRKERIEALYKFSSGKEREEFLKEKLNNTRDYRIYYISSQGNENEIRDFIDEAKSKHNAKLLKKQFVNTDVLGSDQFWNLLIKSNTAKIFICINEAILEHTESVYRLIKLFLEYDTRLFVDPNVTFLFSNNVLGRTGKSILNYKGRREFLSFWNDSYTSIESLLKETDHETVRELLQKEFDQIKQIRINILKLVNSLAELYKIGWNLESFESKNYVEVIQPLLRRLNHYKIKDLNSIIPDLEKQKKKDLLCVISYDKYYEDTEKKEMEEYFRTFYSRLSGKHNIMRIFNVKARRSGKGDFVSTYSKEMNENLYNYIKLIQGITREPVYLLFYTQDTWGNQEQQILYEQDYIIALPEQGIDYKRAIELNLANLLSVSNEIDNIDLFFTYPEDQLGVNKMIQLTEQNTVSIQKWLTDFSHRTNPLISNHKIFPVGKGSHEEIKKALKLN